MGYSLGTALAAVMTVLAIKTQIGTDLLETLTAMFNPLPAIALLPLALIWFGLGAGERGLRSGPFGDVGRRPQHPFGLSRRIADACAWSDAITGCAERPMW